MVSTQFGPLQFFKGNRVLIDYIVWRHFKRFFWVFERSSGVFSYSKCFCWIPPEVIIMENQRMILLPFCIQTHLSPSGNIIRSICSKHGHMNIVRLQRFNHWFYQGVFDVFVRCSFVVSFLLIFTCSKSPTKTLKKDVKYVQN